MSLEGEENRIPFDIIIEILSWLPVRSILRFRCVCKLWRSILNDSDFIHTHLERSRNARPTAIILSSLCSWQTYHIASQDNGWAPNPFLSRPNPENRPFRLRESCNGLLCFTSEDGSIELMNPATRESLILPKPAKSAKRSLNRAFLGFHPVTKEYKVIHFFANQPYPESDIRCISCEVYTLGGSSWRQISGLAYFPMSYIAVVKGVMYWLMPPIREEDGKKYSVVSFDLKEERFTRISLPNFEIYKGNEYKTSNLVELEGNVCMTVFPYVSYAPQLDIWMLNNDHEWTLKYSVSLGQGRYKQAPLQIHHEKILMYVNEEGSGYGSKHVNLLRFHDLKNKGRSYKEIYLGCDKLWVPLVHVESLVALRN